jgi:preprotein translocase subunit SecD
MQFRTLVIYSLIAMFIAGVLMQAQGTIEIRAASSTEVAGWQQTTGPGGFALWVSPASALTRADIARGELRPQADGGRAVAVVFTADGARKMAQLSAAQIDKPIALLLDGKVIAAPIMRGTIDKEALLTGVMPDTVVRMLTMLEK